MRCVFAYRFSLFNVNKIQCTKFKIIFLNIYVKRSDFIISNILCNKIKRFFILNLIKYDNDTTIIAQYFIKQIIITIVVVVAICVALLFSLLFVIHLFFKFLSQLIDIIKRLFS